MENIRTWLMGVVFVAFAVSIAQQLAPKGREQALVRLVGGVVLLLSVLQPVGKDFSLEDSLPVWQIRTDADEREETLRKAQEEMMSGIIAERTEAYILDKACQLGIECAVTVTVKTGASDVPLPDTVHLSIPCDDRLASIIAGEIGIPAHRQIWQEEGK